MWIALLLTAAPAAATEIGLAEAIARAATGPRLEAQREAIVRRQELDRGIGGLPANPELRVSPGARSGPDPGPEIQLSLEQGWSLGGLGTARRAAAQAERHTAAASLESLALSRGLAAAQAWTELWGLERLLAEANADVALAEALASRTARLAQAGERTEAEAAEAKAFRGEAEALRVDVEGRRFEAMLALAEITAGELGPELRTSGEPDFGTSTATTAELSAAIDQAPELREASAAAQSSEAHQEELAASQAPQLLTGLSWAREATGAQIGLLTLGLRLPIFEGDERGRGRASYEAELARAQVAEVRRQSTHRLLLATHEVEHAREKELVLRSSLLAAAEAAEQSTSRAEQAGTATLLELLWARRRSSTARRALIEQQAYRFYAQAQLALLLGARPVRNTP